MTAKDTKTSQGARYGSLDDMPPAPPLGHAVKTMGDADIEQRPAEDPGAGTIPAGFWEKAEVVEPEGTEPITLRLPRHVLGHFKAAGKGYPSRISRILASYLDATSKKAGQGSPSSLGAGGTWGSCNKRRSP